MSCLGFDWKISEVEGVGYVPLEQVGEFYGLKNEKDESGKVTLRNSQLTLELEAGSKKVVFNRVKFSLKLPVRKKGEFLLLSKDDLTFLVDPVLRPSNIKGVRVGTIILDMGEEGGPLERKIEERLEKRGFKVVMLDRGEKPLGLAARVAAANEGQGGIYLQIIAKEGQEDAIKTTTVGKETKASVALATALHWGINHDSPLKLVDGGISIGDDAAFNKLEIPGVKIEVTVGQGDVVREVERKFFTHMSKRISDSLHFATSAFGRADVEPEEEK